MAKAQKPIKIKAANKGKLRKSMGAKKGQKIPKSKLSKVVNSSKSSALQKKRAQFAINAAKWKKK